MICSECMRPFEDWLHKQRDYYRSAFICSWLEALPAVKNTA